MLDVLTEIFVMKCVGITYVINVCTFTHQVYILTKESALIGLVLHKLGMYFLPLLLPNLPSLTFGAIVVVVVVVVVVVGPATVVVVVVLVVVTVVVVVVVVDNVVVVVVMVCNKIKM